MSGPTQTRNEPVVGLFGYYSHGNFGDNLMAYMFYRHLESIGISPVIYSSDALFAEEYGMRIEPSLEAFIAECDMIVLGGGGLMTPRKVSSGAKQITSEMRDLVRICRERSVPIYGISIGGNGIPLQQIEPVERRELIAAAKYTTLRNLEDMPALEELGRPCDYYPDVVWTSPEMFRPDVERGTRGRIGINIYTRSSRRRRWLEWFLMSIVRYRRDLDFLFISVSSDFNLNNGTIGSADWGANCKTVALHELQAAVNCLASLDCLITSKLHIGMTAMSLGVPAVSYAGEPKTRLVYNRIGFDAMAWSARDIHKLVKLFALPGSLRALKAAFAKIDRAGLSREAMHHYAKLTNIVLSGDRQAVEAHSGSV